MRRALCALVALVVFSGAAAAQQTSGWETDGITLWMKSNGCMVSRNADAYAWEFTSGNGVFIMRHLETGAYDAEPTWGTPEAYAAFLKACGLPNNIPQGIRPTWMKF